MYPLPPFHSLRVTAGLVSKKVVKIELTSDRFGTAESKGYASHFSLFPPPRSSLRAPSCSALSPSRPRRSLVPSAPVRGLYHRERTDLGRHPAFLSSCRSFVQQQLESNYRIRRKFFVKNYETSPNIR